jgi:cephalosporin hydroxylase
MRTGKEYWDLKIEETIELFKTRPEWMGNNDNDYPSGAFIKGLIEDYKPKNMLEIGTAAGWAAYYMLDEATRHNKNAKLTSVDLSSDTLYYTPEKAVGDAFREMNPKFAKNWNLQTGQYAVDFLIKDNEEKYDFVFIDAHHYHPWASLDLLASLPHIKEDAIIVFHDSHLNQIALGLADGFRHPDWINTGQDQHKGPYVLYKLLEDQAVMSYDDITPNAFAIQLKNKEDALSSIYCALNLNWEKCYYDDKTLMEFYSVLLKLVNLTNKYFGKQWAEKMSEVIFNKYEVTESNNNMTGSIFGYINYVTKMNKLSKKLTVYKVMRVITFGNKSRKYKQKIEKINHFRSMLHKAI